MVMGKIIVCNLCGEEKKSYSKGFCKRCYQRINCGNGLLTKVCTRCKQEYPNTREYFGLTKSNGLIRPSKRISNICVDCTTSTTRKCNTCNQILPVDKFQLNSLNCHTCAFKKFRAKIKNDKDRDAEFREKIKEYRRKERSNLPDHYIKKLLIAAGNNQPTELDVIVKRAEIIAKRKQKHLNNNIYVRKLIQSNLLHEDNTSISTKDFKGRHVKRYKKLLAIQRMAREINKVLTK